MANTLISSRLAKLALMSQHERPERRRVKVECSHEVPAELRSLHCLVGAALLGVMVGSEKVQGDVGLIADDPAVVRYRRDVE